MTLKLNNIKTKALKHFSCKNYAVSYMKLKHSRNSSIKDINVLFNTFYITKIQHFIFIKYNN